MILIMKYEAEIWWLDKQVKTIYDADFDYCIEICINRKNGRSGDDIILKIMKT